MTGSNTQVLAPAARARLARTLVALPERLTLVVVALALAAGLAVTAGLHYWWVVLPLAVVLAALGWRLTGAAAPTRREAQAAAFAVAGTVGWAIVNIAMAAEYLIVVRDPGFLTLSGMWLVDHPHTDIPAAGAVEAAALQSSMVPDANEAWNLKGDVIQPQGAKMLPATIAIGGWIAGDTGVLGANVIIGAAGILAVYALARQFLSPMAALAPAGALALTVSHIGLSRPAYSEPLTLLLVVTGILWAWRGVAERSIPLLAMGAVASGATTLVRIDGASFAIGALAGVGVALALRHGDLTFRRRGVLTFLGVQALTLAVGYLSVYVWSTEYFDRLADEAYALLAVYGAGSVVLVVWALLWRPRVNAQRWLSSVADAWGERGARVVGGAVVAVLVVLASRPLWTVVLRGDDTPRKEFTNGVVEGFQRAQGLPIDPQRTYAESTVTWLSYYLTWPLVVLGMIGLGYAAYRMVRRDAPWAVFLGAVLAPSLMYLWRPSIVPDQIWAIRRFEPATLPGWLLAAAAAAWMLAGLARQPWVRQGLRRGAGIGFLLLPLTTWLLVNPGAEYPISSSVNVTTREMIGARDQLDDLCALAPGKPIVLVGTSSHYGSLRVTCDVPVVLALGEPTRESLADMEEIFGEAPLVLTRSEDQVAWTAAPSVVVDSLVKHSNYVLQELPSTLIHRGYAWYAGVPNDNGVLEPLR